MHQVIQLLIISLVTFMAMCGPVPRSSSKCSLIRNKTLNEAKKKSELEIKTLHLYCAANSLRNMAGTELLDKRKNTKITIMVPSMFMENDAKNKKVPLTNKTAMDNHIETMLNKTSMASDVKEMLNETVTDSNVKIMLNETFNHFTYECKNFIIVLSLKHQLQDYLLHRTNITTVSRYMRPLLSILIYLQTMADILDDIELINRGTRCLKLTTDDYKMMYYVKYNEPLLLDTLFQEMENWIDLKNYKRLNGWKTTRTCNCIILYPKLKGLL